MLSPGDAVGIAGICGVVIAAILRSKKENGCVLKGTHDATVNGFKTEFKLIHGEITNLNKKMDILIDRK